jgi:hypothetical protein
VSSQPQYLSRPVTENPVVGSLVRAMQKSGLPIAERPNLLLKGSDHVNRILGPEEELTGPLEKSLRQARRQKEAVTSPTVGANSRFPIEAMKPKRACKQFAQHRCKRLDESQNPAC